MIAKLRLIESIETARLKYINREPRDTDLRRMIELENMLVRAEDHAELLQVNIQL